MTNPESDQYYCIGRMKVLSIAEIRECGFLAGSDCEKERRSCSALDFYEQAVRNAQSPAKGTDERAIKILRDELRNGPDFQPLDLEIELMNGLPPSFPRKKL